MQRISRSPYPSLAIDEPLQSFLNIFSAYIEPADRLFFTICYTNISFLFLYLATTMKGTPFGVISANPSLLVSPVPMACNWKL